MWGEWGLCVRRARRVQEMEAMQQDEELNIAVPHTQVRVVALLRCAHRP